MRADGDSSCGLCGTLADRIDLVHGGSGAICRVCVEKGVAATLASTRHAGDGATLPRAHLPCFSCGQASPPAGTYRGARGRAVCTSCLHDAYDLFTQQAELAARRRLNRAKAPDPYAATLVSEHFAGLPAEAIVTASRTFAAYLRPDLQRALDAQFGTRALRCVGLHASYTFTTLTFASLGDLERDKVRVVPLHFEEVDIGEREPVRCVQNALWLLDEGGLKYAVVFSMAIDHGRNLGWHVEIAVPVGSAGEQLVREYFQQIEAAIQGSVSYRGKVLSLECHTNYRGTDAGTILVHTLAPVTREQIILPDQTLALLERNVFRFAAQRDQLAALKLPIKKGLLFYGPPGTGKTHTIRYLAGALSGHTTLLITADQVQAIAQYMELARLLSPAIVVIEDVDLIARHREDLETPAQESLLNGLLNEMDGLRENTDVLFILTTNRPEALEAALASRPGRIDQAVEFPLPDAHARRRLLDLYRRELEMGTEVLSEAVRRTEGVSAAFIKELVRRTAQFALEREAGARAATHADLDLALREMLFEGGSLNAKLLGARSE